MRSTIFKQVFAAFALLIGIWMCGIMPAISAYAYEVPKIEGEDVFNDTAEKTADGTLSLNPANILNSIKDRLVSEMRENGEYIIVILCIAAMSASVNLLSNTFGGISKIAEFACFALMSTAALKCFTVTLNYGTDVINGVCAFVNKVTPILIMTLYVCGNVSTGAAFQPVLSAAVYIISIIIESCLMPLICFSSVMAVAGNIDDKVRVSNFQRVLRSVSKWIMGAVITIFTAVSAVYGFSAPALDAVGGKAVKFAVGSLVPVVGNFLSDTLDTVLSGTRLVKNAVGTAGMAAICVMCIVPILKIFVIQLMLKIAAALCEPMADKRISAMLWDVSDSVMIVMAVVIMVMVLFLINIGIILAATGF